MNYSFTIWNQIPFPANVGSSAETAVSIHLSNLAAWAAVITPSLAEVAAVAAFCGVNPSAVSTSDEVNSARISAPVLFSTFPRPTSVAVVPWGLVAEAPEAVGWV